MHAESGPFTVRAPSEIHRPARNGLAIAALVCGLAGLVGCLPAGLVGLVLGIVALVKVRRAPDVHGGKGMAIGGVCTGAASLITMPIMMALLIPRFFPSASEAAWIVGVSASPAEIAQIETAKCAVAPEGPIRHILEFYRQDVGRYPREHEGLSVLLQRPANEEEARRWKGPYLESEASLKDPWGREFRYEFPSPADPNTYELWSVGPDGMNGTSDDIRGR
jgi:type II secretion system protein G